MKVAIVLNAGKKINREICADKVICADGGYLAYGKTPNVFIGDFDSFSGNLPSGVEIVKHNVKKNDTDGTLSVEYAINNLHATDIELYGVLGGREDHVLGNLTLLALSNKLGVHAMAKEDNLDIHFANTSIDITTQVGQTISILPYGGECVVAHSQGLEYPLENLTLTPYDTRGISNITNADHIHLDIAKGEVLVFHHFNK